VNQLLTVLPFHSKPLVELRNRKRTRSCFFVMLSRCTTVMCVGSAFLASATITLSSSKAGAISSTVRMRDLQALKLVTGYGEVLGDWCLVNIEEEQSHLLAGGIPRKQGFNLEFVSYGNDLQNV